MTDSHEKYLFDLVESLDNAASSMDKAGTVGNPRHMTSRSDQNPEV